MYVESINFYEIQNYQEARFPVRPTLLYERRLLSPMPSDLNLARSTSFPVFGVRNVLKLFADDVRVGHFRGYFTGRLRRPSGSR